MARGESPAVARRRLRLALRHAREERGFTQGQVAAALEWSLSKVQRIESGDVTVSRTDLKALLDHLGVTDPDWVDELIQVSRISRRKGWWDDPRYRQHLTPATLQLLQFESEATAIRIFSPTIMPGVTQTRDYAEQVFLTWQDELTDADRTVRLEVRMRRREIVFNRPDPPTYLLLMDESVLHREVGGREVMAEQLRHLLSLVAKGAITARIVPYKRSAPIAMLNHFILFDLGDENEILYREAQLSDSIDESVENVRRYRERFEHMWGLALSPEATVRRIEAQVARILSALDGDDAGFSDT